MNPCEVCFWKSLFDQGLKVSHVGGRIPRSLDLFLLVTVPDVVTLGRECKKCNKHIQLCHVTSGNSYFTGSIIWMSLRTGCRAHRDAGACSFTGDQAFRNIFRGSGLKGKAIFVSKHCHREHSSWLGLTNTSSLCRSVHFQFLIELNLKLSY